MGKKSARVQFAILFLALLIALFNIRNEHHLMGELRRRYDILLGHLRDTDIVDPRFSRLRKRCILTGISGTRMNKGTIGYNVNKGYEIYICLDGGIESINSAMNVLIHELAHVTVDEYDHSPEFWTSFKDLKDLSKMLGIYEPIQGTPEYCSIMIRD